MIIAFALVTLGIAIGISPYVSEWLKTPVRARQEDNHGGELAKLPLGNTFYRWAGPEEGRKVVCVHGLTTPSSVYDGLIDRLAENGFRVLSYDLYGRGYSDRPHGLQTPEFFSNQLNDLLCNQGITEKIIIIGNSLGSAISADFTARYPDRIAKLVLLVPAGMGHKAGAVAPFWHRVPGLGRWTMQMAYPRLLKQGIAAERHLPATVANIYDRQIAELSYRGFLRSVFSSIRGTLGGTLVNQHQSIAQSAIPTIAIWGEDDSVIPLNCKDKLSQWNPGATQIVLKNAGHGLVYTHTDTLIEKLLSRL